MEAVSANNFWAKVLQSNKFLSKLNSCNPMPMKFIAFFFKENKNFDVYMYLWFVQSKSLAAFAVDFPMVVFDHFLLFLLQRYIRALRALFHLKYPSAAFEHPPLLTIRPHPVLFLCGVTPVVRVAFDEFDWVKEGIVESGLHHRGFIEHTVGAQRVPGTFHWNKKKLKTLNRTILTNPWTLGRTKISFSCIKTSK